MRKIFLTRIYFCLSNAGFPSLFLKCTGTRGGKKAEKDNDKGYAGVEICQTCHPREYDALAKTAMGTMFLEPPSYRR